MREKHEKTQAFQISRNPCNSQNMRKGNSHNTGKVWEKTNIPKLWVSQIFFGEAEIHTVPKTWERWISIVQEKHRKTQTFHIYGLS